MSSVLVIDSDPASATKIASALTGPGFRMVVALGDKSETELYSPSLEVPTDWDYYMQLPTNEGAKVVAGFIPAYLEVPTDWDCYMQLPTNEGAKVVAGFIPALVGDKPRPYKIATATVIASPFASCHSEPFASCHSEGEKRPKNLVQGRLRRGNLIKRRPKC